MASKLVEKKKAKVKDLLNQIIMEVGQSKDEFLTDVAETAKAWLKPTPEESEDNELDVDVYESSEDYYDSNCY